MNGAQDLGGMQGFGPILPEADEPWFHAEWERRTLALTLAMAAIGRWNLDMTRHARETIPPAKYLASSYYEIWFEGLRKQLVAAGLVTVGEIRGGTAQTAVVPGVIAANPERMAAILRTGNPVARKPAAPAKFEVGSKVRTREMNPSGHTRLPRYCRGKTGTIVSLHGAHVFPDSHAAGRGEQPEWLYTVRFDARELWGADTTAASVCVSCWEPYLETH